MARGVKPGTVVHVTVCSIAGGAMPEASFSVVFNRNDAVGVVPTALQPHEYDKGDGALLEYVIVPPVHVHPLGH